MTKDPIKMIEDCRAKGEPFFVIRAKDMCSIAAMTSYNAACQLVGAKQNHLKEIYECFQEFACWQHNHPHLVKIPDTPVGEEEIPDLGNRLKVAADFQALGNNKETQDPPRIPGIKCNLVCCSEREGDYCVDDMKVQCHVVPEEYLIEEEDPICEQCNSNPQSAGSHLCGPCIDNSIH